MTMDELFLSKGLPAQIAALVRDQLSGASDQSEFKLVLRNFGSTRDVTVIRNEDFPALEAAATIVGAMAGNALTQWAPLAVASLIVLLFTYRRKMIALSGAQAVVVLELKRHPGLTTDQLTVGLRQSLDPASVVDALAALQRIRRVDGAEVTLVNRNAEGVWYLLDA
jgi:hypothetical protein